MGRTTPSRITGITATALGAALVASAAGQVTVSVDNGVEHQVFDGFGATHHDTQMFAPGGTTNITASQRTQALDIIFNQVKCRLGDVPNIFESPSLTDVWANRFNDNADPFSVNWNGFNTLLYADRTRDWYVNWAPAGTTADLMPDARFNHRWANPWQLALRTTDYQAYLDEEAERVLAGAITWQNRYGTAPARMFLMNEPTTGNHQLGYPNTPPVQAIVDLTKRCGERLWANGFAGTKFVVVNQETEAASIGTAQAIANDPQAAQYVAVMGYHPYSYDSAAYPTIANVLATSGSGNPSPVRISERSQLKGIAATQGWKLWMTEVTYAFGGGVDATTSMDLLRGRAIHIHDEFVYANANAYFGMNNMWSDISEAIHQPQTYGIPPNATWSQIVSIVNSAPASYLWNSNWDMMVLIRTASNEVRMTGMARAMGHYARWINQGARRVEATSSDPLVQVCTFRDDSQNRLVSVLINNASASRTVNLALSNVQIAGPVTGEQSTAGAFWQPVAPFQPAAPAGFSVTLPAYSVTTLSAPLQVWPENALSVTDTFADGTPGPLQLKWGTGSSVVNEGLEFTSGGRHVLPGRLYGDSSAIVRVAYSAQAPSGSYLGVLVRAATEAAEHYTNGPQRMVYLRKQNAAGDGAVYLRGYDPGTGQGVVLAQGPTLAGVLGAAVDLEVRAEGDRIRAWVGGTLALDVTGQPVATGYTSLTAYVPTGAPAGTVLRCEYLLARAAGDVPEATVDANGHHWISLVQPGLFSTFDPAAFTWHYNAIGWDWNLWSQQILPYTDRVEGFAAASGGSGATDYAIFGSTLFEVAPGDAVGVTYAGQSEYDTRE